MGDRYGITIWEIGRQWDIDRDIDMGYVLSIWDMGYRYGYLPYRHGQPGYRYGIWANDMGDDSIDMVILHIDMGYLVTLLSKPPLPREWGSSETESMSMSGRSWDLLTAPQLSLTWRRQLNLIAEVEPVRPTAVSRA
jgi:hypothetical protein